MKKVFVSIVLAVLLLNPISLILILYFLGISFEYSGHRTDKVITVLDSISPLPPRSTTLEASNFGGHDGEIQITDWQRKPITIYDSTGKKLLEYTPAPASKNHEYLLKEDEDILTGKTADSFGYTLSPEGDIGYFPDLKLVLYNSDGTQIKGPYENGKLYDKYSYNKGKWTRYRFKEMEASLKKRLIQNSEYFFQIPAGGATLAQRTGNLYGQTFLISSNTQFNQKPSQFFHVKDMYRWKLQLKYEGVLHHFNFATIKNPPDLIIY